MKTLIPKLVLLLSLLTATIAPIPSAKAQGAGRYYYSPFGNDAVIVRVGYWAAYGSVNIFWQQRSTGTCSAMSMNAATLSAGYGSMFVYGSPGDDEMVVLPWNDTFTCTAWGQVTLSPPTYYNGIYLFGQAGNDVVQGGNGAGNHGLLYLYGGTGNDLLFNYGPNTGMYGGDGNDTLWTNTGGNGVILSGEGGDDCLDMTASPTLPYGIWCGGGTDRSTYVKNGSTDSCEIQTTSCL